MRRLAVYKHGKVVAYASVDDADHARLRDSRWRLTSDGYAARTIPGTCRSERLHRVLMGLHPGDPVQVDHRNRRRLDCRRQNLRLIPGRAEQAQNVRSHRDSRSRFRGVSWCKATGRWRALVYYKGTRYDCGRHANEEDAARAADEKRLALMPWAEPQLGGM